MESTIQVKDKRFEVFITAEVIDTAVSKVAESMNTELHGKDPLFLIILNGAFMFAADLLKKVTVECSLSFVKLASYSGTQSTNVVRELIGLNEKIEGRNVIIIEDIIDTGQTLEVLLEMLKKYNAASVQIATLLFKPEAFKGNYKIDYIGMDIPNDFIIGYGLDYDGYARNLPDIYKIVSN